MSFDVSRTAVAMSTAGLAVLVIGAVAARKEIAAARGLDKIAALANLCFAAPLAVFGALHLFGPAFVAPLVPRYMPWRTFWVYAIGVALIAAAVSIATRIGVFWSGLLFGIMMFLFVAMMHLPGALRLPGRIIWTIVFRESAFGGAGWVLAGIATERRGKSTLVGVGRVFVTLALLLFGVEHFLFPTGLPGVPLEKQMPEWVPLRPLIDYLTGAALLATGVSVVVDKATRRVAACAGGWLLLLILVIYGPVMIGALKDATVGVQVEGINYFADTLMFTGAILALARAATPRSNAAS